MKFFLISIRSLAEHEQELNGFLCRHRVVSIERRVVENGGDNSAANCRLANHNTNDPTNRNTNTGFRLALNSAGRGRRALSSRTEQIIFRSEAGDCFGKIPPAAARCW
jgi:hypothetical protein